MFSDDVAFDNRKKKSVFFKTEQAISYKYSFSIFDYFEYKPVTNTYFA